MSSEHEMECPHEGCTDALFVQWFAVYTLSPDETVAPVLSENHAESWQIECAAGHVLVLPGPRGCGCDDPEGPTCSHDPDDYDWSDENSILRDRDLARLRDVIGRIHG